MRHALILRARAARVIAQVLAGTPLDEALRLDGERDGRHGLVDELAIGAVREAIGLGHILDRHLRHPLKERDRDILGLLLAGLYQARNLDTPAEVAVSSAVAATEALHKAWAKGLVNAVLRAAVGGAYAPVAGAVDNYPVWLVERLRRAWPDDWRAILTAGDMRPPLSLRLKRDQPRRDYLKELEAADMPGRAHPFVPTAVLIDGGAKIGGLPGFADGRVTVQDAGAQLAAPLLAARPGDRILDACAAPGGKTLHLADMYPEAAITAIDRDPRRLARLQDNLARQRPRTPVEVRGMDLAVDAIPGPFDAILLDAPCSATGVIRRHPDIKLLRTADDVTTLTTLQSTLLDRLWTRLAPGGSFLYVTCSVLPEENERQITAFLARTRDARESIIELPWGRACSRGIQLLPRERDTDGFFYARLTKEAD